MDRLLKIGIIADSDGVAPVISRLSCSLAGKTQTITITPGTLIHQIYGKTESDEKFQCRYGLNETYQSAIVDKGLHVVGGDGEGAARIVELIDHRFFIATLFLPQLSSTPEKPHPLFAAFINAAIAFRDGKPLPETG